MLSYVILTTNANDSMREIHHRMPLVLKKELADTAGGDRGILEYDTTNAQESICGCTVVVMVNLI